MKTFNWIATSASLLAVAGISASVWAHSDTGTGTGEMRTPGMQGMHGMGGMHGGQGMRGMSGESSQQLGELKAALKLTAEQQPVWEKFEQLVGEQNAARRQMRESMHSGSGDHSALRNTMIAWQKEAFAQRSAARQALYAVLTAEQRVEADRYIGPGQALAGIGRQGSGHRH